MLIEQETFPKSDATLSRESSTSDKPLGFVPLRVKRENLTPQLVRAWVDAYRAANGGSLPSKKYGQIAGTNDTWRSVDGAMRFGLRGWQENISLSQWLRREYASVVEAIENARLVLSPALVTGWVAAYRKNNEGRFPNTTSGLIGDTGMTWAWLNESMSRAGNGWRERISLLAWLKREYAEETPEARFRPVAPERVIPPQLIAEWVTHYRQMHHGRFPQSSCGVCGTFHGMMMTWSRLDGMMSRGTTGWPEQITLSDWLDREYAEERVLTPELLRKWVAEYRRANEGRFPNGGSGRIPGTNYTWQSVTLSMKDGRKGWPQKIKFSEWLRAEYGGERDLFGEQQRSSPRSKVLGKTVYLKFVHQDSGEDPAFARTNTLIGLQLGKYTYQCLNLDLPAAVQKLLGHVAEACSVGKGKRIPRTVTIVINRFSQETTIDWTVPRGRPSEECDLTKKDAA